jgi:hypothetical protein
VPPPLESDAQVPVVNLAVQKALVLVDTLGLLLHAIVHPANIQDRDGGILLLATLFGMYPFLADTVRSPAIKGGNSTTRSKKILPHLRTQIVSASSFCASPQSGSCSENSCSLH